MTEYMNVESDQKVDASGGDILEKKMKGQSPPRAWSSAASLVSSWPATNA